MRWYYTPIAKPRGEDAWNEHAEIIEAIAAGDAERAGERMRRHTDRTTVVHREWHREDRED